MLLGSRAYGAWNEDDEVAWSAYARLRLQKPDWSQVLKFSFLTDTVDRIVLVGQLLSIARLLGCSPSIEQSFMLTGRRDQQAEDA